MGVATVRTVDTVDVVMPRAPELPPEAVPSDRPPRRLRAPQSARGRMVAVLVVLLVAVGVLSIGLTRAVLINRVDRRVDQALQQEIEEARLLLTEGTDPLSGMPFSSLARAFDVYFERNVPSLQETHVAFVDDDIYRQRLRSFPVPSLPDATLDSWAAFSSSGAGERAGRFETSVGVARFRAVSVEVGDERGAFVVAILPSTEMREIGELQTYGTLVFLIVLTLATASAWALSGRILAPVRELTETARSISETDRHRRVAVDGGGTEATRMAEHFNAMLDRLDAVHYSQLAFVEAVGHELRTPLTVATGHLELLEDDNPEHRATIELVLGELNRMGRLVGDLQTLAESERDDYVVLDDIDAEVFAHDLIAKSAVLGRRTWTLAPTSHATFSGDGERLTEAVLNLVDNAVKHTDDDDEIEIGVGVEGDQVRLWVRDSGPGLDLVEDRNLFDQFVRGEAAAQRYRGSGLGLAIVRAIARAHHGDVTASSSPGGACFTIAFPTGACREPDSHR